MPLPLSKGSSVQEKRKRRRAIASHARLQINLINLCHPLAVLAAKTPSCVGSNLVIPTLLLVYQHIHSESVQSCEQPIPVCLSVCVCECVCVCVCVCLFDWKLSSTEQVSGHFTWLQRSAGAQNRGREEWKLAIKLYCTNFCMYTELEATKTTPWAVLSIPSYISTKCVWRR